MKLLHLSTVAVFACRLSYAVAAEPSSPRVTVELSDGSRIVGQCLDKKLRFHSALLGEVALPIQDIRSVDCSPANSATVTTTAGDALAVSFEDSKMAIKTSFGKADLPVASIRKVTVAGAIPGSNLPGLVALWSGSSSGKDAAGAHDASVSPGISYLDAKTGPGFYFDGGENQILVPGSPDLNFGPGQDFSIEAWIEPASPPPQMTDDILPIADKRITPNNTRCLGFVLCLYHGQLSFRMSDNLDENGDEWHAPGPNLFDGNFHQVAVTVVRNAADGGKLYVDGQLILTFDPTRQPGDLSTDQPLNIGGDTCPGYYTYFHGLIDNLAVFNRALSPEEIKSLDLTDHKGVQLPPGRYIPQESQPGINGIYDYPDTTIHPNFRRIP